MKRRRREEGREIMSDKNKGIVLTCCRCRHQSPGLLFSLLVHRQPTPLPSNKLKGSEAFVGIALRRGNAIVHAVVQGKLRILCRVVVWKTTSSRFLFTVSRRKQTTQASMDAERPRHTCLDGRKEKVRERRVFACKYQLF